MMDIVRDLSCGTVAGIVGKFVDYPFDTVKTRMQAKNCPYKSTIDCITRMWAEEGLFGYYNGITAPISGAAFENAFAFTAYTFGSKLWRNATGLTPDAPVPIQGCAFAGSVAGVATSIVLTPVELLKCRVQVNPGVYKGVFDCAVRTIKADGFFSVYSGVQATLLREVPGNAAWFGFYELVLKWWTPPGKSKDACPWYAFPIAGGIGGLMYWTAFFPADVVKTLMQTDKEYATLGFVAGLKQLYKEGGVRALYRGYGITCCRAIPANATIFSAYEASTRAWKRAMKE